MATLIERQCRCHMHPIFCCICPVQQRSDMPVIPDIVCTAAIDRDGSYRSHRQWFRGNIVQFDMHDFYILLHRHKTCDLGLYSYLLGSAHRFVPHITSFHAGFFLLSAIALCFLFSRHTGCRPDTPLLYHAPEIPRDPLLCQIPHALWFQQKMILIQFCIAAQIRRNGTL